MGFPCFSRCAAKVRGPGLGRLLVCHGNFCGRHRCLTSYFALPLCRVKTSSGFCGAIVRFLQRNWAGCTCRCAWCRWELVRCSGHKGRCWVFARHASDGERISLEGSRLVVELESGGRLQRAEFNRDWVRVEPKNGGRSLIQLSAQGRSVEVGRYVLPELRSALAREIRMALRHA